MVRDHEENKAAFAGPRYLMRIAELDMHPLDTVDRKDFAKEEAGVGYCNITKCCSEVCPEGIHITDNAIIPMKERVVDRKWLFLGIYAGVFAILVLLFFRLPTGFLPTEDQGAALVQFPWAFKPSNLLAVVPSRIEIDHTPGRGWFRAGSQVNVRIVGPVETESVVTCLMPGHDRAGREVIAETVASVQRQDLSDWEYILVDDGSNDGTADLLHELARNDSRIAVLTQANGAWTTSRQGFRDLGLKVVEPGTLPDGSEATTPVVPVLVGEDWQAVLLWKALFEAGVFTNPVIPPAVEPGHALKEAQALGLVNRVVPPDDFDQSVSEWAEKLASKSPLTGLFFDSTFGGRFPATLKRTWESVKQIMGPGALDPLTRDFPDLKIVLEHITTAEAAASTHSVVAVTTPLVSATSVA